MIANWYIDPPLEEDEEEKTEHWRDCFGCLHHRRIIVKKDKEEIPEIKEESKGKVDHGES